MPQVLDAPEAAQEERRYHYEEKTEPLSSIAEPRHARPRFLAALRSAVTSLTTRHAHPQQHVAHPTQRFELPIDRVAREHPFLFIKAMSG